MPRGTVEEFLSMLGREKRPQFVEIISHHWHWPPSRDEEGRVVPGSGRLNKTSRNGTRANPILCPFPAVLHVLRQSALLGVDYERMVNLQREREASSVLEELAALSVDLPSFVKMTVDVEEFRAEALWGGNGEPDPEFPKLACRHKKYGERYIRFWPACDEKGKVIPHESRFYDEDEAELDFDRDLKEFWKKDSGESKGQGTKKPIRWSTVKFSNIVQIKAMKLTWLFQGPPRPRHRIRQALGI